VFFGIFALSSGVGGLVEVVEKFVARAAWDKFRARRADVLV
jgi:hypothetical protein